LQLDRKDVGRSDEKVRPEILAHRMADELRQILLYFLLGRTPREVAVGLREAELRQRLHRFRAREGFRQEDRVGMAPAHFADQPLPERQRLCMRIIDPEDVNALFAPEQDDVAQRLPQRDAVGTIEIRIDDVFVFLRRVLGEFDRAVRPVLEPFRMLLQPGVIRRALHREIERDFHIVLAADADESAEVVKRAELRMHGVVAAVLVTNGVKAARVAGLGRE
jgi:hypothetical protein